MRPDLKIIADLIKPGARVLDLGCGEGELLAGLQAEKQVNGYGLDVDPDNIAICVRKGVNVIEQNLDQGLANFPDDSFDMVVMTETLQSVRLPAQVLDEMLRIGQECIVTFPISAIGAAAGTWSSRAACPWRRICPTTGTTRPTSTCVPSRTSSGWCGTRA